MSSPYNLALLVLLLPPQFLCVITRSGCLTCCCCCRNQHDCGPAALHGVCMTTSFKNLYGIAKWESACHALLQLLEWEKAQKHMQHAIMHDVVSFDVNCRFPRMPQPQGSNGKSGTKSGQFLGESRSSQQSQQQPQQLRL